MDESNEKARHWFVTAWLWGITIAMAFFILEYSQTINNLPAPSRMLLLFNIAVIVANILVLRWKIIGFFIICAVATAVSLDMIFNFYNVRLVPSIGLGVLLLSIYFGILNIRKNGISVWKHLLNEAKAKKRETKIWGAVVFGPIILFLVIAAFPITRFYGNTIVVFAPQRILQLDRSNNWDRFGGRVLGNHVLETEYGEIRIGHLSPVSIISGRSDPWAIFRSEIFEDGRSSHNLVFLGGEMPEHLGVWLNRSQIIYLDPSYRYQDMSIYGVPVRTGRIRINSPRDTADIVFFDGVGFLQEHITLADSTVLNVTTARLSIYKDEQRWVLEAPPAWRNSSLFVKRDGETEFAEYRSITFKANWGEFIEGVRLEE